MKNNKTLILFIVIAILVGGLIVSGIFIINKPKEEIKENNTNNGNNIELVPLTKNTNDLLSFIEEGVNKQYIGTYAFIETYSFNSYDTSTTLSALNKDGSVSEILTFDLEDIKSYSYKDGIIYITTIDKIYFIDIREGNGNYYLQEANVDNELLEEYKLVIHSDKFADINDNSCIYINSDDYVCQVYYDNDSEYIMHYLTATVNGKTSWKLDDKNKSFYHLGILSNNRLLIEIHENGKIITDTELAIVDLATGKIVKNEKLNIENKGGINLYYIN